MVTTRSQSGSGSTSDDGGRRGSPPSPLTIGVMYLLIGAFLSFTSGRDPSQPLSPEDLIDGLVPTIVVICLFLVSYSLYDVMAVGGEKMKHGLTDKTYASYSASKLPEEVYLAQRAQLNQVEQMTSFVVSSISFSLLVNGKLGAVLSFIWTVLRRYYASKYRAAAGKRFDQMGLGAYTIPAYFIMNGMLMGSVVQCVRILLK
eukprot:g617.t1 g617   contig10:400585-401190(-)